MHMKKKIWDYTVTAELFLEVYAAFENGEVQRIFCAPMSMIIVRI